ncbi:hypothetical protein ZWY2020_034252 [Hordeum vulgare]|nr:hypothetical protein ZWY2020_034252 [Hordeum vulgare]
METGEAAVPPRATSGRRYKALMPWRFNSRRIGPEHHYRRAIAPVDGGHGEAAPSVPDRSAKLPTIVRFYSLKDHGYVYSMKFRSAVYSIRCSPRVVGVSRLERVVRLSLYCPDGTRKKLSESQQMDERRDWKRELVQTLVDKYNDQHHLSGV